MAIEVGQEAPPFTLPRAGGGEVSLADYRGRRSVALVFFPQAFSPFCTPHIGGIADNEARYADLDAQVIGVSVDNVEPLRVFAEQLGLRDTVLLSDFEPKGEVARAYGVYSPAPWGMAGRAVFVIDAQGVVRYRALTETPLEIPDEEPGLAALAACRP
jgi:peroxiredoxin